MSINTTPPNGWQSTMYGFKEISGCKTYLNGNAVHAVHTQCEVLDVGKYSDPTFGPF